MNSVQNIISLGGKTESNLHYTYKDSKVPLLPFTILSFIDGKPDAEKLEEIKEKLPTFFHNLIIRPSIVGDNRALIDVFPSPDADMAFQGVGDANFKKKNIEEGKESLDRTLEKLMELQFNPIIEERIKKWDKIENYKGFSSILIMPKIRSHTYSLTEHPNSRNHLLLDVMPNSIIAKQNMINKNEGEYAWDCIIDPGTFSYSDSDENILSKILEIYSCYEENSFIPNMPSQRELLYLSDERKSHLDEIRENFDFKGSYDDSNWVHVQQREFFPWVEDKNFQFEDDMDLINYFGKPPKSLESTFRNINEHNLENFSKIDSKDASGLVRKDSIGSSKRLLRFLREEDIKEGYPLYLNLNYSDSSFGTFAHGTYTFMMKQTQNECPFVIRKGMALESPFN